MHEMVLRSRIRNNSQRFFVGVLFALAALLPFLGDQVLAPFVIICLGIVSLFLIIRILSPVDEFRFLIVLCLCAFLLRAFLASVLHHSAMFFGPDAGFYDQVSWDLAKHWGSGQPVPAEEVSKPGYVYFVGAVYLLFGHTPIGAKIANGFLGTLTILFIYLMSREIYGRHTARIAAILTAWFPSLVLWSALMLKDTLSIFLIVVAIWSAIKLRHQISIRYIIVLLVAMAYLTQVRYYILPFLSIAILSSFLVRPVRGLMRGILTTVIVLLVFAAVWRYMPNITRERFAEFSVDFAEINRVRAGFSGSHRGSAFLGEVRINSSVEALRFLPLGLSYFFFAPFPWQVHGLRQMITIPEMMMWYCLIPFMIYGFLYTVKNNAKEASIIIIYVALLTLAYTFGITNMGALYRFRAQMLVFYLIFVAVGIARAKDRNLGNREELVSSVAE